MSKPRIFHIFPSFEVGGSQRRLVTYLNRSEADFDHYVYAMDGCYDAAGAVQDFKTPNFPEKAIPKGSTLAAIKTCRQLLAAERPDLLITYNWGSIEWALANRNARICPTIQVQDGFAEDEQSGEKWLRGKMRRFVYRRCDKVVVPSYQLKQRALKRWKVAEDKLHHILNGVDLSLFDRPADKAVLAPFNINDQHFVIGTIARLKPEKNIGRLIEAFSQVEDKFPNARLVIVGDGFGMSALKMLAERICVKDNVVFYGSSDKPEELVAAFDIFALSSDTEQMPISVIEAMATGLPVVSTDVGDTKFMVSEENKPYVVGLNADPLASNMSILAKDEALRRAIGKANKAAAQEKFGLDSMIDAYDALYRSLL